MTNEIRGIGSGQILSKDFYATNPRIVAKALLGKRLVRKLSSYSLEGIIVETEAYYGLDDPASRAYKGIKEYNTPMWSEPGRIFIYNVHKYWMLNIVAHEPRKVGAVLIRALEPIEGIAIMRQNRSVNKIVNLTNGPGKLTLALGIDKNLNNISVTSPQSEIFVKWNKMEIEIESSHRIGVKADLKEQLRFFIRGNLFVTK